MQRREEEAKEHCVDRDQRHEVIGKALALYLARDKGGHPPDRRYGDKQALAPHQGGQPRQKTQKGDPAHKRHQGEQHCHAAQRRSAVRAVGDIATDVVLDLQEGAKRAGPGEDQAGQAEDERAPRDIGQKVRQPEPKRRPARDQRSKDQKPGGGDGVFEPHADAQKRPGRQHPAQPRPPRAPPARQQAKQRRDHHHPRPAIGLGVFPIGQGIVDQGKAKGGETRLGPAAAQHLQDPHQPQDRGRDSDPVQQADRLGLRPEKHLRQGMHHRREGRLDIVDVAIGDQAFGPGIGDGGMDALIAPEGFAQGI